MDVRGLRTFSFGKENRYIQVQVVVVRVVFSHKIKCMIESNLGKGE